MDRAEHDRRLAERLAEAEPVRKSGDVAELVFKDHNGLPADADPIDHFKLDTCPMPTLTDARPWFGDERDDHLIEELQGAFELQTEGILRVLRREHTAAIGKLEERIARAEGTISALDGARRLLARQCLFAADIARTVEGVQGVVGFPARAVAAEPARPGGNVAQLVLVPVSERQRQRFF